MNWKPLSTNHRQCLAQNLAAIREQQPAFLQAIGDGQTYRDALEICLSKGQITGARATINDTLRELYPQQNRAILVRQQNQAVDSALHSGGTCLVFSGSGTGQAIQRAINAIIPYPRNVIVVCETNLYLITVFLALVDIRDMVREKRLHIFAGEMAFDEASHFMQAHYLYLLNPREVHYLLGTLPCKNLDTGVYIQQAQSLAQKMHNLVPLFEKDMDIFSIQMKQPLSAAPKKVWACANPQAYIHYPIAKAFLRGFSQQGLQTTLANFERPLSSQCKVVGSLFTSCPDLLFTINAWPSALLEDIGLNPSLVQNMKRPRICWIVDNTSLYESEKSHYPISPHDWYFCSDRHFMSYIQPQTSQVSFLPAATMFDKKGTVQDRFSVPLSYVGSLPDLQACLTALPPICRELLRELEIHDSRQALPTYTAGLLALSPLPSQRQAIQQTACQFCATTQKGFTTGAAQLEYFLYNAITFYKRMRIVTALLPLGLHVYGPTSWRDTLPPPYQDRYGGFVHHRDLPDCYASAKISLNIHSSQCPTGLNPRDFDVPMAGGVVLGDYVEDVERGFLVPGQETISFTSPGQAVALAERYLNDEDQWAAIREQGHQRVKAEHTYTHRASAVLEMLRKQGAWGATNDE